MSAPKRKLKDEDEMQNEKLEEVPFHTVVISNFGDTRPVTVPEEVVEFFLIEGRSVTNYVVRPGFGSEPMFLANYRRLFDKYADGTDHPRKG